VSEACVGAWSVSGNVVFNACNGWAYLPGRARHWGFTGVATSATVRLTRRAVYAAGGRIGGIP
jgi:hypothetical protein